MDLTQLAYFVAVAEEKSFTRGAERAHVVQSTASAAVARLEAELGQSLFARVGHRIELTVAGRTLYPRATRMLEQRQELKAEMESLADSGTGVVTLGTPLTTGGFNLAGVLSDFHRDFPRVSIRVVTCLEPIPETLERVRNGSLDLALTPAPEAPVEGVLTNSLGRLRLVLATPHDWPKDRALDLNALAAERFIDFAPGWASRDRGDRFFAENGLSRDVAIEVADVSLALDLVAGGLGVALLPRTVTAGRHDIQLVDIDNPLMERILTIARPDRVLNAATNALYRSILHDTDEQESREGPDAPLSPAG